MRTLFRLRNMRIIPPVILSMIPLIQKMIYMDHLIHNQTGTQLFGGTKVFVNDSAVYLIILLLFYVSYLSKVKNAVSILLRCMALALLFFYVIDYLVIVNFNTHLVFTDVMRYASYALKYIKQIHIGSELELLIITVATLLFFVPLVFTHYRVKNDRSIGYIIALLSLCIGTSSFLAKKDSHYVHSWMYKNFIEHNLMIMSEAKSYSPNFVKRFTFEEKRYYHSKTPDRRNIILLMVESLSSYQSRFFSGVRNWTPHLDAIAEKSRSYTHFFANGFTTEDGQIALLTGQLPIYSPSNYTDGGGRSFKGFFNFKESLPNHLKKEGYTTEYLTTADLNFSDTRNWVKSIGFDYIAGHSHPLFEKCEKFHFQSAPDEALYRLVLERIKANRENPYFIFIKTVSTHHPFINPEDKSRDEAGVFQYADRQIGIFYQKLRESKFFDNGILVIVGDHHAMVPIKEEEISLFGPLRAAARVPMILSDGKIKGVVEKAPYQQTDLCHSLMGLVSNSRYHSEWTGNIFMKQPPKYITFRRGDKRNIVSVISGDMDFLVKLNGDKTKLITGNPEDQEQELAIVQKINSVRIFQSPDMNFGKIPYAMNEK